MRRQQLGITKIGDSLSKRPQQHSPSSHNQLPSVSAWRGPDCNALVCNFCILAQGFYVKDLLLYRLYAIDALLA